MKKNIVFLSGIFILLLSACAGKESINREPYIKENIYSQVELVSSNADIIYENKNCGYRILFPEDWNGWFNVYEIEKGCTQVWFEGVSTVYSVGDTITGYPKGSPMFYIITQEYAENNVVDSIEVIGEIAGEKYFVATGSSSPWDFSMYPSDGQFDEFDEQLLKKLLLQESLTEEDAILLDQLKARKMSTEISQVLRSFGERKGDGLR